MSSLVNAKKVDGKANPLEQAGQGRRTPTEETYGQTNIVSFFGKKNSDRKVM